ncbi:MAG TPA: hypothetical protein VF209_05330, partial [Patescibacteria group bacterium]
EARTNDEGRAQVSFPLVSGTVIAQADGYGTYTKNIQEPVECKDIHIDPDQGQVLGTSTQGQVLGATTLADTGNLTLYSTFILISLGAVITSVAGYGVYQEAKA